MPPEPPEPPDCGLLMTEGVICHWKEQRLTLVTAAENVLEEAEQDSGAEILSPEESTPAETSPEIPLPLIYGAAIDELRLSRELAFLSHEVEAQLQVSNYDHLYIKRGLFKVISRREKKLVGFGWSQKKVDLTFNPMGQTHKFIITPPIFANIREVLQVEKDMDKKKFVGTDWAQNPGLSMNFKVDASVNRSIGAPKIDVDVTATSCVWKIRWGSPLSNGKVKPPPMF